MSDPKDSSNDTRSGAGDDGLPSIAPSRDDIETRRTSRRGESVTGRSAPAAGGGIMVNIVLAVLLAGLTACGWFLVTQNEALAEARSARADAEARLARIEDQLSITGQALSETETQTQTQIEFWESEIRKLWDVTNKRNRAWIEENQAAVKKLQTGLDSQSRSIAEVRAQATDLRGALETQDQLLEQVALLDRRASELLSRQRTLTDSVNTLRQSTGAMDRRVTENEEAVESIDAFRRDAVSRLTRLQDRLDALGRASSPSQTLTPSG